MHLSGFEKFPTSVFSQFFVHHLSSDLDTLQQRKKRAPRQSSRTIIVPGTNTRFENPRTKQVLAVHQEIPASSSNGLNHTTCFMAEQIRAVSNVRFRRLIGTLEGRLLRSLEDRLRLALDLFQAQ